MSKVTNVSVARTSLRDRAASGAFLLPTTAVVGVVLLLPFVYTIARSFFGNGKSGFVGLENYAAIFTDDALRHSLLNTVIWALGALLLPVGLGLAVAVMTTAMKLGPIVRALVILPYALAGTVVGFIGTILFSSRGAVNQVIEMLSGDAVPWLLQWPFNVIAAILIASWQTTGVNVVLYMVGLQTIPRETVEAAALDGADGWIRFKDIIVPQLRPITAVVIGLTITNALRAFDVIWVLTSGGPNRSSETLALSMYRQSFLLLDPAVGSAIAVVLAVVVVACSWLYLRRQIGELS